MKRPKYPTDPKVPVQIKDAIKFQRGFISIIYTLRHPNAIASLFTGIILIILTLCWVSVYFKNTHFLSVQLQWELAIKASHTTDFINGYIGCYR